ncbi:tetratricopeptide repeat protein [Aestuariibaculum sediminum]|uniref:Tetratricopeptide repeat protein n=1 Tax=Aestuariibaculum sediminum TaxID=2770637 RepID=A0A8J6Q2P3_9FLAO|nr:tetratricopeptide repeat protein [Aestuariibaculum sediminum]MBD0832436.1 tetratricopeptide repeat protein [Aestuariibaculum sediminum]
MKKTLLTLICISLTLSCFSQAGRLIREASRTTNLEERIKLYSEAIALEPDNLDAYFLRGLAKNDLGDFHGAIIDYSKIILSKPDPDTYFNRGNSRYALNDYFGAEQDYEKAFEMDSNFIDALYSLGCAQYELEKYEEAIKTFSKVIRAIPLDTEAYYRRADSFKALKNYPAALNDYSLAVKIDQTSLAYYNRGVFLMSINYYKDALSDFKVALRRDKTNTLAYFFKGTANLLLGEHMTALEDYNTAITFDSKDFDALIGLSITYYKLNDYEQAELFFEKAKTILAPNQTATEITPFEDTYWYTNQYYYFKQMFEKLNKL